VAVLYEPRRTGSAALDLAGRLVGDDNALLTIVGVAPQDTRICCGAGSANDYNRAVCVAVESELQQAQALLGDAGTRASFKLLVQHKDPPLAAWIDAAGFDIVLLPARRRPLRGAKHPAADQLCRSTSAEVRIVEAPLERCMRARRTSGRHRLLASRTNRVTGQRTRPSTRTQDW
jgi:hypothetical protein